MDKEQLVKLLKEGHMEAYRWASQCCNFDHDLAKDVLQTVYLKILEDKARFNEKSSFRTWLFAVIRYTSLDSLKRRVKHEDLENAMFISADETGEDVDYKKLLCQLPEKQGHVLLLAFYHDMTLESISIVMNITLGAVRAHYDRGKKRLKELIKTYNLQEYERRRYS